MNPSEQGPEDIREALNAWLRPAWPFLVDRIRTPVDPPAAAEARALHLGRESTAEQIDRALAQFGGTMPGADRRGVASLWLQWHAVTAWPPLVALVLGMGRHADLSEAGTALLLDADGCPCGLRIAGDMPAAGGGGAPLETLARGPSGTLIERTCAAAGMSPRVGWSNVANVLAWSLNELRSTGEGARRVDPGYDLLRHSRWSDGTPNPLHTDAPIADETGRPLRRTCCLRYRLSEHPYCTDCPIPVSRRG